MILSCQDSVGPRRLVSAFSFCLSKPLQSKRFKAFQNKNFRSSSPSFCALSALLRLIPSQVQISAFRFQFSVFILLGRLRGRLGTGFGTGKPSRNPCIHWSGTAGRVNRGVGAISALLLILVLVLDLAAPSCRAKVQGGGGSRTKAGLLIIIFQ